MKVVIVGAGVAGLSAATMLCEIQGIEVVIYEKEKYIGGQMSSMYTDKCNVEHSWRVFNSNYHNLWYIFNKLGILENFTELKKNCVVKREACSYLDILAENFEAYLLRSASPFDYHKYTDMLFRCKERNISEYDNISAYDYFNGNNFLKLLLGPYAGLEAKKVSVSGIFKNMYSLFENKNDGYGPKTKGEFLGVGFITKLPTNDAIFDKWEKYLVEKKVKIFKNSCLRDIDLKNNRINAIVINSNKVEADEFIMSLSLRDINKIIQNKDVPSSFKVGMNALEKNNLQLYFTFNLYFSKQLLLDCDTFTLLEEPWSPVIQRKVYWPKTILNNCYSKKKESIKEVWNVGVLDYFEGKNNKILSNCSLEEALEEGIRQIKENEYVQSVFKLNNTTFDDCCIDYESFETFQNVNNKLIDTNPKYSVNVGTLKNTPKTHPESLPENMYLSGYYVDNTYGGATMESSCITGLNAAQMIITKHNLNYSDILPFKHDNEIALNKFYFLYPFQLLDKVLFYFNLPPITNFVNSFFLMVVLVIIILSFIMYISFIVSKHLFFHINHRKHFQSKTR